MTDDNVNPFQRTELEDRWAQVYPALLKRGYELPKRYHPDWVGSWCEDGKQDTDNIDPVVYEDACPRLFHRHFAVMDATRSSDSRRVCLKILPSDQMQHELQFLQFLNSPELRGDPRNHCVPLLDFFETETRNGTFMIIVMPYLCDSLDHPPITTYLETLPLIRQFLEGLVFLHENNIAHRDFHRFNFLVDSTPLFSNSSIACNPLRDLWDKEISPVFPKSSRIFKEPVPAHTRLDFPGNTISYYFIDFDVAIQLQDEYKHVSRPKGAFPVPEEGKESDEPHDPFPADVFLSGGMILGLGIVTHCPDLRYLANTMIYWDPADRPTARQSLALYQYIVKEQLHWVQLLRPIYPTYNPQHRTFWQKLMIWVRFAKDYARVLWGAVVRGKGAWFWKREVEALDLLDAEYPFKQLVEVENWKEKVIFLRTPIE